MLPEKAPDEVAQGKRSILAYLTSSPAVLGRAADRGVAAPVSSPARPPVFTATAASAQGLLAAPAPAAAAAAGPTGARRSPRVASRPPSEAGDHGTVKHEGVSPSKAGEGAARYPLRQRTTASATPGPADKGKGKGKGKAPAAVLEIPDSSSEGEQARSLAQRILGRSPHKRTPAGRKYTHKKENYKWTTGRSGRDELDLTLSSPPSTASTLGDDDSDDSEIVVISFKDRKADMRPRSASGSLTPRAAATKTKPRPMPLVKNESHSSIGPSLPSSCRQSPRLNPTPASAKGKGKEKEIEDGAAPMLPPSSPMRRTAALAVPAPPSRATSVGSPARPLRSGSKSQAISPVVEIPVTKRARSLSTATPRVAVTSASPVQARDVLAGSSGSPPRTSEDASSRPTLEQSSSLSSVGAPVASSASAAAAAADISATAITGPPTPPRAASYPGLSFPTASLADDQPVTDLISPALRASPTRTPQGGPSYVRDPSGSPLSPLGPSPRKLSPGGPRGPNTGKKAWREHTFELVIPPAPPSRRSRTPLGGGRSASSLTGTAASATSAAIRRPAFRTAGVRNGEVRRERDGPTSEWDAFMREERVSSGEDDEDDERGGSPSPAKRARGAPASDGGVGAAGPGGSSGSSSDGDPGSDSDADDFAAMLAAAKAKREAVSAGAAAASVSGGTSPTTAKTTVSPPVAADTDEPQRPSRARHAPAAFSPSKSGSSSKPVGAAAGKKRAVAPSLGLVAPSSGGRGSGLTFEKIMREREDKAQRGRGREWFDGWAKKLGAESADGDSDDEGSDAGSNPTADDLAAPSALSRIKPLDASRVASALANHSDDDLPAPAVATKKAREVERVLAEEREAERRRAAGGETREEREVRGVWRAKETGVRTLEKEAETWEGDGWRGSVAKALKDGIASPVGFPSTFSLFSPLRPTGLGTPEDRRDVARWLLSTITHPSTPAPLADRLTALLHRIALHAARAAESASSALLTAEDLLGALVRVGAKESLRSGKAPMEKAETEDAMEAEKPAAAEADKAEAEEMVAVGEHERREIVGRWCRVVQALSGSSPRLLSDEDTVSLSVICVRLSLDPTSATSRSTLSWTVRALLASLPDGSGPRIDLFHQILVLYAPSRPRLQLAVLQAIPHDTEQNKGLRRWLAWAFLANEQDVAVPSGGLTSSVLSRLLALLSKPPPKSPFRPPPASDGVSDEDPAARDNALAECARILFIALSSLDLALLASPARAEERKTLDVLLSYIQAIDSRLRTDARKGLMVERLAAKNLLTALHHAGTYQLRAARGQTGGFGFSDEEERALARSYDNPGGGGRAAKKVKTGDGADGMKQTALAFRKPVAAAREADSKASTSDQEVEDVLMKL
ncbi:hypothetical protein JCM3770_002727 [Rhodotorula araucariae]